MLPLFLVLGLAVTEFTFLMNANLSNSFATRDAALVGAEAGNSPGADCLILKKIEDDISAPADVAAITSVEIYWSDQSGAVKGGEVDTYTRTPTTPVWTCPVGASTVDVHFDVPTSGALLYPETDRCNVILGSGCSTGHGGLDTIGVKVTYGYKWHTPLRCLVALVGQGGGCWSNTAGWTLVSSNAMQMEPVL